MLSKRQLTASGYVRYSIQSQYTVSKVIQDKLQILCYQYYGEERKQLISKDQPKIKIHCGDTDKQFSCFIGTQLNGLYDNLIYSAKNKFQLERQSLNIYAKHDNGNKSHFDENDKQKYFHLYLEEKRDTNSMNAPFVIEQSCTDISKSVYTNIDDSFRRISASSNHSFHSDSSSSDGDYSGSATPEESDEIILLEYGYKIIESITETFDGCIYKAEMVSHDGSHSKSNNMCLTSDTAKQHFCGFGCNKIVCIKKIDKRSEKYILKEAKILHYLTVQNKSLNNTICAFIDLIDTKNCFYLIQQFGGIMSLEKFTQIAHKYIQQKRLKIKQWKVIVKWIFWQIVVDMFWMHHDMYCFHLDLNMGNIFVQNAIFIENKKDNCISIDATCLTIKMCGFGLSQVFKCNEDIIKTEFKCNKSWLPQEYKFTSPQILDQIEFDAAKADSYSLGIILYTLCCGLVPYQSPNVSDQAYCAIKNNKLLKYLNSNGLSKYFSKNAFEVIKNILNFNENKRINMEQILCHRWFKSYYSKSKTRIQRKRETQKLKHFLQKNEMKMFPYYNCQK